MRKKNHKNQGQATRIVLEFKTAWESLFANNRKLNKRTKQRRLWRKKEKKTGEEVGYATLTIASIM